jgi:hypothetical protein
MIFEELRNYKLNLQYYYKIIEEKEHLGIADKSLIKKRYQKMILEEANADSIDCRIPMKEMMNNRKDIFDFGVSIAGIDLIFEKKTKYF